MILIKILIIFMEEVFGKKKSFADFYNSPGFKGSKYQSRRRQTEIDAKNKVHSPSPTFNCIGPNVSSIFCCATFTISSNEFLFVL